ncbi:MAG: type II toxin-antitoxin system RelE/ParE family toxin [Bdellovibrionaceae bacterium]|nr:type II toxin-antitoxin system RelE/ParE family toxin [Pseudobdellovibrionaceae bacterium]MBX3033466.1 type II toxin-antitoxin system RelE/ParE family toxin [Pseudobdellovibrionaceae bacterium]
MTEITLVLFQYANGLCPYQKWFDGLKDLRTQAIIDARITRIRQGLLGDHRSVGKGVFEFRIDWGPGYRIYFAQEGKSLVLLLGGGDKKSQLQDIRSAKEAWLWHQRRKRNNER